MNLTEQDAYALRRAVSMMDVPDGLGAQPVGRVAAGDPRLEK